MGEKHIVFCKITGTIVMAVHDESQVEYDGWLHIHNVGGTEQVDVEQDIADVAAYVRDEMENENIEIGGEG